MITEHEREEINLMGHILYPNNNYNMNLSSENIPYDSPGFYMRLMPALLVYWNGQYFMQQVVEDNARLGWIDLNQHY